MIGFATNVGLLVGNVLGYWSFAETLITYIFEILLFTVLGYIYLTATGKMHNPGAILIGGFFIIAIAFGCTLAVSYSIGELTNPPQTGLKARLLSTFHQVKHIWPIFFMLTVGGIIAFFNQSAKDRVLSLQTTLFYKIFLVAAIIAAALLFVYSFGIKSKLVIVIITIIARIGLDYYLNPVVFKSYLKRIGINR